MPEVKINSPYGFKNPILLFLLMILGFFACFLPLDWMQSNYWPQSLIDMIGRIFPPVSFYAEKSHFPQITKAYMAFSILTTPVHFIYCNRYFVEMMKNAKPVKGKTKVEIFTALVFCILFFYFV
jgi:hypothetical protein